MTRYTVLWDEDVESQFIDVWIAAGSPIRTLLTEVANWIDHNLADDPETKGQLRPELGVRIVAVPVTSMAARVSVAFQVLPDDRQIRIVRLAFKTPTG